MPTRCRRYWASANVSIEVDLDDSVLIVGLFILKLSRDGKALNYFEVGERGTEISYDAVAAAYCSILRYTQVEIDMNQDAPVLIIMGSTRAGRVCPTVAEWIAQLGRGYTDLRYELVDLEDWLLPMNDEPAIPATGRYAQAHTSAWSEKIKGASAIIFVTPQYNWGYPAVLKNAIDHLYAEWHDKPAVIVTYGGHGGTKCAEQLKQVAGAVKLRLAPTAPALTLPEAVIREGAALDPTRDFGLHVASVQAALAELIGLIGR